MNYNTFTEQQFRVLFETVGMSYQGIQRGSKKMKDLVLFKDPLTGSSLALPICTLSVRKIVVHVAESRKKFNV